MSGKSGSRKTRRRQPEPYPSRDDALTLRIAAKDRQRRQDNYLDDVERDIATVGWVSKRTKERMKEKN